MQTLYRLFDVSQIATAESEIIAFVNGEVNDCIEKGDVRGAGEWLASRLDCAGSDGIDGVMAKNIALWASPSELGFSPASMDDLLANLSAFDSELLSIALISLVARRPKHVLKTPGLYRDLAFRLSDQIERIYGVNAPNPTELCNRAAKKLQQAVLKGINAVKVFSAAQCIVARNSSIELLKSLRQLKLLLLPHERPILSSVEMLLGSGFREFCQNYERSET